MAKKKNSEDLKDNANRIIKNHMIWSMGAGFIPVPIADFFAVSAMQLDMIRQLSNVYEIDFEETKGKAIITALAGSSLARMGASAVKFIPGVGTMLGSLSLAVLSGASTYALGEVFKKHFETGGTFLDFDPSRLMKYYNEKFEKGKDLAREMKKKHDEGQSSFVEPVKLEKANNDAIPEADKSIVDKLKDLAQLKKDGILSDEEFEALKKKIISA